MNDATFNKFGYHQLVRTRDSGGVREELRLKVGKVEGITQWADGSYSYDIWFRDTPELSAHSSRLPEVLLEPVKAAVID